jgi:hypothetical protein
MARVAQNITSHYYFLLLAYIPKQENAYGYNYGF